MSDVIVEFFLWPCVCTKGLLPQTAGSNHNLYILSAGISRRDVWKGVEGTHLTSINMFTWLVLSFTVILRFRSEGAGAMNLYLAMAYTCSLTNNRASLLTILMFSTGFLLCSCTVLYTVANTLFGLFPVDTRIHVSMLRVCQLKL